MFNRLAAGALVLGGLLILFVSLLANVLGPLSVAARLGIGQDPGFGIQQTLGAIVGLVGLVVGVWLWRQGAEARFGTVRFVIAGLALLAVIGGPIFLVANRSLRPSAVVEACVEVESVPSSAGGAGQKRVKYGVRIANTGKSRFYVDSVVLKALRDSVVLALTLRDSAKSWLPQSEIVAIEDMVVWQQIDSVTIRPSTPRRWSLSTGDEFTRMRSIIVPIAELSPLYWFFGIVFLRHRDPERPIVRYSAVNWIDNFRQECP
jgi:hypothetical protein